jgi:hypothetical protein
MPYKIRKLPNSDRYKVFNSETGKVHSEHTTKKNAKAQVRLLYSIDNGDSSYPKEEQSNETAGEGVNHKGRKKGSKNKVKKPPKDIVFQSRISDAEKERFHEPLTKPIGNYSTTWRWVLYREKEKQGITYPLAMKQKALKDLYYKLKEKCQEIDDKIEEETGEPVEEPTFSIDWLEQNWDKNAKRLPALWQEQLCGKSGKKKKDQLEEQDNKIDKYFKPPKPPSPPPPEPEPDQDEGDNQNIQLNIEEKDDAGEQDNPFNIDIGQNDPDDIELPNPTPSPKNIEKAVLNIENKILELKAEGEKHGLGTKYEPEQIVSTLMYLHLLEKYSNNCAVITTDLPLSRELTKGKYSDYWHIAYEGIDLRTDWKEYPQSVVSYLADTIDNCIKRGVDLILVPLNMRFFNNRGKEASSGHANVLVVRPLLRIMERYEPHGSEYGNSKSNDVIFNKALRKLVEEQMTYKIGKYKYREPNDICPNSDGFQSFEGQFDRLLEEGGGFCAMWSCFLMELVLMNPDYTTKQIIEEAFKITNKEPKYLKEVIRGYVVDVEKVLDQLIKNVMNEEFKFRRDPKTKKDKKRLAFTQLHSKKTLLQNYIIGVLFQINNKVSDVKQLPEEPIYEETEQVAKPFPEIKALLETKKKNQLIKLAESKWDVKYIGMLKKKNKADLIDFIMGYVSDPRTSSTHFKPKHIVKFFEDNP